MKKNLSKQERREHKKFRKSRKNARGKAYESI